MALAAATSPIWRVRDRRTFAALSERGARGRQGPITVLFLAEQDLPPRVAYAVGRSTGSAVVRNRLRRRLRAIVRELQPVPGAYLVRAAAPAAALPYDELRSTVRRAIDAAVSRSTP